MSFETPILFVIFNRPETTSQVFEEIRKIKPSKLYIVADGPRPNKLEERENCKKTRKIVDSIDWECEVFKNYSDTNLGCKKRVSSGIDWFFENVEQGIILEDDCLPNQSFFRFCEEMLERYKYSQEIAIISGNNFNKNKIGEADYYFSKIPHIWGWATWRRTWNKYDVEMKEFPRFVLEKKIKTVWNNQKFQKYWLYIFNEVYNNKINTWDYQLSFSIFLNNTLCINPNINLVSNIGFGKDITNTIITDNRVAGIALSEINFPIKHLGQIIYTESNDNNINMIYQKYFKIKYILKKIKLFDFTKRIYLCLFKLK